MHEIFFHFEWVKAIKVDHLLYWAGCAEVLHTSLLQPLHLYYLTLPLIHGHQSGACSLLVFIGCTSL